MDELKDIVRDKSSVYGQFPIPERKVLDITVNEDTEKYEAVIEFAGVNCHRVHFFYFKKGG